jgi:putative transposase
MEIMKRNQTFHRLDYHIVFSTINREPLLDDDLILHLTELVRQKAIELDFILHILNGAKDHLHLLLSLPPKYSVSHIPS